MKHIKEFTQCNEAKMFDDHKDLIKHSEMYFKEIYIERPTQWKKKLKEIIESDGSYRSMGYSIMTLIEEVSKDLSNLNNFSQDIKAHIKELDEIYQTSQQLSPADEKAYDELEELDYRVGNYEDFIEQYIEDLQSLSESLINVDEKIGYLMKLDFKSFY